MTVLRGRDGELPPREADFIFWCSRCLAEMERTATGATVCPNGCPP